MFFSLFFDMHFRIIDIYYGTFRSLRAFCKILLQSNKWRTFKALNNTPLETGYTFALNCYTELGNKLCLCLPCFLYLVVPFSQRNCYTPKVLQRWYLHFCSTSVGGISMRRISYLCYFWCLSSLSRYTLL